MYNSLVSIITCNYNSDKFILDTIKSVQAQTYKNWEMIIIDDCSSDNSISIIKDVIKEDSRVKLIELEKNSGPAKARNEGISHANGKYITFLDSDDIWSNSFLSKSVTFCEVNNYDFICSSYTMKDESLEVTFSDFIVPEKVDFYSLLKSNSVSCLTAMYNCESLGKCYMPNFKKRQDLALWLDILNKTPFCFGIQESLAIYRLRKQSVSSNKIKAAYHTFKVYNSQKKINLLQKIYYFCIYAINGIKKYNNVKR